MEEDTGECGGSGSGTSMGPESDNDGKDVSAHFQQSHSIAATSGIESGTRLGQPASRSAGAVSLDNIKLGCQYDVLDSSKRWCEGEVTKIDRAGRRVFVSYMYWDSKFDEWVSVVGANSGNSSNDSCDNASTGSDAYRGSSSCSHGAHESIEGRLVPLHTHTYYEGGPLRIGQRVEALDECGTWLEAFVLEVDFQKEQVLVHFKGYHPKFDDWIPFGAARSVDRIRPFGRRKQLRRRRVLAQDGTDGLHRSPLDALHNLPHMHRKQWKVPSVAIPPGSSALKSRNCGIVDTENEHNGLSGMRESNNGGECKVGSSSEVGVAGLGDADADGDLHDGSQQLQQDRRRRIAELSDQYLHYIEALETHGLTVVPVSGDGNCLFRAVAHQVYDNEALHGLVRQKCVDYMEVESEFFSQFVEGGSDSFPLYLQAKRMDACWGDDPEIEAVCELYGRSAEIWAYDPHSGARKLRTFHEGSQQVQVQGSIASNSRAGSMAASISPVMRLSYYGGGHYDSIVASSTHRNPRNASSVHGGSGSQQCSSARFHQYGWERNLEDGDDELTEHSFSQQAMVPPEPGVIEDQSIERSLLRRRQRSQQARPNSSSALSDSQRILNTQQPYDVSAQDVADSEETRVRQLSDQEATEQLTLLHALEESRRQQMESDYDDLETSLLLCMQQDDNIATATAPTESKEEDEHCRMAQSGSESRFAELAQSQSAASSAVRVAASLEEQQVEASELRSAQELSERDYLESAILSSALNAGVDASAARSGTAGSIGPDMLEMGGAAEVDNHDSAVLADRLLQQQIEEAKIKSLESAGNFQRNDQVQDVNSGRDTDLDFAILLSVAERAAPFIREAASGGSSSAALSVTVPSSSAAATTAGKYDPILSEPSRNSSNPSSHAGASHLEDEEHLLQLALAESLHSTNTAGYMPATTTITTTTSVSSASPMQLAGSSTITNLNGPYPRQQHQQPRHQQQQDLEEMDDDLMRAIEESLKHK